VQTNGGGGELPELPQSRTRVVLGEDNVLRGLSDGGSGDGALQWSTTFTSAAVRAFIPHRRLVLEPQATAAVLAAPRLAAQAGRGGGGGDPHADGRMWVGVHAGGRGGMFALPAHRYLSTPRLGGGGGGGGGGGDNGGKNGLALSTIDYSPHAWTCPDGVVMDHLRVLGNNHDDAGSVASSAMAHWVPSSLPSPPPFLQLPPSASSSVVSLGDLFPAAISPLIALMVAFLLLLVGAAGALVVWRPGAAPTKTSRFTAATENGQTGQTQPRLQQQGDPTRAEYDHNDHSSSSSTRGSADDAPAVAPAAVSLPRAKSMVLPTGAVRVGRLEVGPGVLGYGSAGTMVFEGTLDGRAVAVSTLILILGLVGFCSR
jgi:hypothetical protein